LLQKENAMKIQSIASLLILSLVLSASVVGCKKNLQKTTPLPPPGSGTIGEAGPTGPVLDVPPVEPGTGGGTTDIDTLPAGGGPQNFDFANWDRDPEIFAAQTVYFDFDKSNIKVSEVPKIEAVFNRMKEMPGKALRIEGHCDERGTEEYNRALGERRALAVREYIVGLGMDPNYVATISFGEDQPVDLGHDEAAWAKNRRAEFILLTKPGASN
jgi:peptidoglycan-associated lipoprotein